MELRRRWRPILVVSIQIWCFLVMKCCVEAQNSNTSQAARTAPLEAQAVSLILEQWGIAATWNTTGDLCSGLAIDDSASIDDSQYNPIIKCDCSYNANTTCHVTGLRIFAQSTIGVIPDELWNLVYLTHLLIGQNLLNGPISSGIGNLTRLTNLDIGINAFSGPLPKELGLLTNLRALGFGVNNFSGPLPSEIGNLRRLEQIYIGSSGVSGPIPSTFANLQNLNTVWGSDCEFTGPIPEFIGNLSQLKSLRLEGNAFTGPIPSVLSNLTSLTELRISGLLNGSSSLDFVTNLKSLQILVLRNNNIRGSIPASIGQLQSLTQLDLSFNNITGQIPSSLFTLDSLQYLFLGTNGLNGSLPIQKGPSLTNIDVSHNQLSGSLPNWVSGPNLQLNFVVNNLTVAGSNSRSLPSGLNCLQNGFPCNAGLGRYSDFAINCGGPQISASNQVVYESDSEALGPSNYFVSNSDKWAVSNVGLFTSSNNVSYIIKTEERITSQDSNLYQTARVSANSMRYYGVGLQNGNYNTTLQFAEIQIENGPTWKRRVFDIFIQGTRVERDFNIRNQAGGQSYRPIQKTYTVNVTSNFLEIHLFWAGKGSYQGLLISAVSVTPLFQPRPVSSTSNSKRTAVIVGVVVSVVIIALLLIGAFWFIKRKKRAQEQDDEFLGMDAKPYTISYAELRSATGDFNSSNKLGQGGFGPVFKGTLSDGRLVAVKQLSVASSHGKSQFITEIATISAVQHRNLVQLYGCCLEGGKRLLVYEYLENKSLDQVLFGKSNLKLNWAQRFEICLGVTRGLTYLHEESRLRIVHRDVKASNILLDSEFIPKISDFGLAKLYDDKMTHISTRVAGTIGYLAPEYAMRGHLTEKVDVFGFGVVALELVSGRGNSDMSLEKEKVYLLEWAWYLHENNRDVELVDQRLSEFNEEEVKRVIGVALMCTHTSPTQRPTMSRVLAMLTGDIEIGPITSKPTYLADWSFDDSSFMNSEASGISRTGVSATSSSTVTTMGQKSASKNVHFAVSGEEETRML